MKKCLYFKLFLSLLFIVLIAPASLAQTPNLKLTPPTQSVLIGNQGTVNIEVENVTNLLSGDIILTFNETKLAYRSSALGSFFGDGFKDALATGGSLNIAFATTDAVKPSGTGTVLTVTFERIAAGVTDICFGVTVLTNQDGIDFAHNQGGCVFFTECTGDLNGDLQVNYNDLVIFAMAYRATPGSANWNPVCDLNGDDSVSYNDLVIFAMHYRDDCRLGDITRIIRLEGDLNFGDVQVGQSSQKILTIHNDGDSTLNVSSISYPTGFSGPWSGPISAGGHHDVTVTFAPTQVKYYSGTLTVNSDKTEGINTKWVEGNGVQDTRIIRLVGNLIFGDVQVGQSSQKILTIHNDGDSTLNVSSISYPTGFSGPWSGPISAGGHHDVTVTFAPTQVKYYSGTLTVNSDKTEGINTKSLSGNGVIYPPDVHTYEMLTIEPYEATVKCGINDTGGENAYMRGVEYRDITTGGPIQSTGSPGDFGVGNWYSTMTNLTPGHEYEVRAYAINSADTGYGEWIPFETPSIHNPVVYRALLIGINDYWYIGPDLGCCDVDVNYMESALDNSSFGSSGTQFTTIYTMKDSSSPTRQNIFNKISSVLGAADDNDVSYFYFSGHGGTDGSTYYLCPIDSSTSTWANDISVNELESHLNAINGTKVVLLDSCNSGGFINKGVVKEEVTIDDLVQFNNYVIDVFSRNTSKYLNHSPYQVLTACSKDTYSYQDCSDPGLSFFTWAFEAGCGSHFSADINHNSQITLYEAYWYIDYLMDIIRMSRPTIIQQVQIYPSASDFVIAEE